MKSKIIVVLDGISEGKALQIAKSLNGLVWGFKITDLLFENIGMIKKLKKFGKVFADAKIYDIPNTAGNIAGKLSKTGADIITVHAEGGVKMMRMAKRNSGKSKIVAVTILTSAKEDSKRFVKLAKDAIEAKVDGIVCSGHDLSTLKGIPKSKRLIKIVPGIRPKWYKKKDDQKQTVTPEEAIKHGADYIVIGRPILNSKNPIEALANL